MSEFYARKPGTWSWELQSTVLFMMTSFLKSRTDQGLPSNASYYDEDVNVYLAGLLASYVDSQFVEAWGRFISPFDIDVAQMARASDPRARYTIYKVNADHLMVMTGIFEPEREPVEGQLPNPGTRTAIGRGQIYYEIAASYGRVLARRDTAAIDVLRKLSRGFASYVAILNHLRSEYFNLIERLGSHEMERIRDGIDDEAERIEQSRRINQLLDLYSEWLRAGDLALVEPMGDLLEEIRAVDPGFPFQLPEV